MKKLNFKKLWIVSNRERSARVVNLDSSEILVTSEGVNRTGKSSLIKSLYSALGADPKRTDGEWDKLHPKILLQFTVDETPYFSLRVRNNIAFYDGHGEMIASYQGITKASEFWGKVFDADIQFPGNSGGLVSPFSAAWFMPFYIDQDTGLNDTWTSFDGLNAYKNYKDTLVDFHSGSVPKEYYLARAEMDVATAELGTQNREREHLEFAQKKLEAVTLDSDLAFDPLRFEAEISKLLRGQDEFNEVRERVRSEIRDLQGVRSRLKQEKKLAAATLIELDADVAFLSRIDTSEIICPTCNAVHETSFANTLRLSRDAETCRAYLDAAAREIAAVSKNIEAKARELRNHDEKIAEIDSILGEKRGELTLRSMLVHESRRIARETLETEKEKIDVIAGKINERISSASNKMRESSKTKRRKQILEFYGRTLRSFWTELNLPSPEESIFGKLRPVINSTGSDLPRAILAYHYAVLNTVAEFSTSVFAPIVFDTAQHQDQDKTNLNAMIKFAFTRRPAGTQIIFGAVEIPEYQHAGDTIVAKEKRRLLSEDSYNNASKEIAPFVEKMMSQHYG